ncbi:MAG: hypothetical protein F4123_11390 [Gemmatimonadetes bacterium]|nr:hypothetical protein [Gemmatimonadota bacterium]MYB97464.1 hypothetical protein [Gemmatimonadota bacterium]MYI46962.1 hypothetical protein [Gemmatimonadota bacterium]
MRTRLLRFAFGRILRVSRKTHEASPAEVRELRSIVEALKKAKLKLEEAYAAQRRETAALRGANERLAKENETLAEHVKTLVGINRNLGRELHRVNELLACRFDSPATRERALRNREVHVKHLQRPSGANKRFTAKDITLAVKVARQEAEH